MTTTDEPAIPVTLHGPDGADPEPDPPPTLDGPNVEALRAQIIAGLEGMRLPTAGPLTGDQATGEITVALTSGPITLPRPTFGQIRKMIRAEEHLAKRLKNVEYKSIALLNKFREDAKALEGNAGPGNIEVTMENIPALEALRDENRDNADRIEDDRDDEIAKWWTEAFTLLAPTVAVDPESWPADLIDPGLPARVVAHWRRNPVGPG